MIFVIEAVLLCLAFTAVVMYSVKKDPLAWVGDYPPAIRDRVKELGLVTDAPQNMRELLVSKAGRCVFTAAVFGLLVFFVNGADGFVQGFLVSYALWFVIAWYDALVLDCLWACRSDSVVIPGTEDMRDAYRDYGFHIKMSALGCVLGIPICAAAGLIVELLALLF